MEGTIVDFGCGKKPFKQYFPNQRYVGIDNRYGNPDFVASVFHSPFKNNSADTVICSEVLEHINEPLKVVKEIHRVIKKGGHLYLTVPMYWYQHYQPNDFWRFTQFSLMAILSQFNFRIKYLNRYGGLNYFIACRISETIYNLFRKCFKNKTALVLLAPFQLLLYFYSLLDKYNKKDVAGWVVLAEKMG